MRIRHDGRTDRFYVQAGFVEVLDDVVSVLTPRAVPASELDRPVVEEQLKASLARPAATAEAAAARREAIKQSRGATAGGKADGCGVGSDWQRRVGAMGSDRD